MKIQTLIRISGKILLAVVVSLAMLALEYIIQNPQMMVVLATIGWNR